MIRNIAYVSLLSILFLFGCDQAYAASRIKDIVDLEGVRKNQLVGYGLVVGLNGTGDTLRNSPFTKQSLEAMLERLGVNTRDANMETKDAAAVMVTAELLEHVDHRLAGEFDLGRVAAAVQAHHQAVANQRVVAHAFDADQVAQRLRGLDRRGRAQHQAQGQGQGQAMGQLAEIHHIHPVVTLF